MSIVRFALKNVIIMRFDHFSERRGQIRHCQQQRMTKALYSRSLKEKIGLDYFFIKKRAL